MLNLLDWQSPGPVYSRDMVAYANWVSVVMLAWLSQSLVSSRGRVSYTTLILWLARSPESAQTRVRDPVEAYVNCSSLLRDNSQRIHIATLTSCWRREKSPLFNCFHYHTMKAQASYGWLQWIRDAARPGALAPPFWRKLYIIACCTNLYGLL